MSHSMKQIKPENVLRLKNFNFFRAVVAYFVWEIIRTRKGGRWWWIGYSWCLSRAKAIKIELNTPLLLARGESTVNSTTGELCIPGDSCLPQCWGGRVLNCRPRAELHTWMKKLPLYHSIELYTKAKHVPAYKAYWRSCPLKVWQMAEE